MGKSSIRKKRSKYSSLDRGRKRSKTKRSKSKKLRQHDSSDSYSTDDSRSSASVSVSSEDNYKGRKSRSSIHKDAKKKRRARSLSSSSEGSLRLRNKKGSRRKIDSDVRRKTTLKHKKKKKSKRDASISLRSSSTCQSSSDSSSESEYESCRGRSQKRRNDLRISKNVKRRSKKRSRSCSSYSRESGGDYSIEQKVSDGNISKRLKSVITFAIDDVEEREKDECKEEIVYEDDGYPSSKSNDSYHGENNKISYNQSPVAYEKESSVENEKREDLFDIKSTQLFGKSASDGVVTNDSLEEKSHEIPEPSGKVIEDLETILRQKALENLRRFRGGKQINSSNNATKKDESCGTWRSPCLISQNDPKDDCTQRIEGDSVHSLQEEKILDAKNVSNDKENTTFGRGISKQRLVTPALKQALSNCMTNTVEVVPKLKLVNESGLRKLEVTAVDGMTDSDKLKEASISASANSEGQNAELNRSQTENKESSDINSSGAQGDVKEGSQLERKTMTVMRGGESVQVSYKVYIPKKAPALTRRQLKR